MHRSESARVAILLDGGFVKRKLQDLNVRLRFRVRLDDHAVQPPPLDQVFPTSSDVVDMVSRIMGNDRIRGDQLLRVYFYDGPPVSGTKRNPLGGKAFSFEGPFRTLNQRLQDSLAVPPDFAVRRGETVFRGWRLRSDSLSEIARVPRMLVPEDLAPHIEQKGVDLRIGLDVALLSVKRIVDKIVLVSGDSDLVPTMKLARREGLWVYLDTMGHETRPSLIEHADYIFNSSERATLSAGRQ